MAKVAATLEMKAILDIVKQFPHGAGIEDIEAGLSLPVTRRTLQRRLQALIARQRLQKVGEARATRYLSPLIVEVAVSEPAAAPYTGQADVLIPLSNEGADVERHVRLVEVIETQLLSLHEGSIARYRLRPGEYQAWQLAWK